MTPLTENKLILVVRRTRLDELISRFNTEDQARFYVEHLGADFSDYVEEDRVYKHAVHSAENALARCGRVQRLDRAYLSNFIFGKSDTVVVLGQDGLAVNVMKYLDRQPIIGVNPDPGRWEGALLPFRVQDLDDLVPDVFKGKRPIRNVSMAKATLNTGETLYGVNDLFIGPRSHTSARYTIQISGRMEKQSSSGIIVSTGLGATGWLRSILAGATGVAGSLLGRPIQVDRNQGFKWESEFLYFTVREPWPSVSSSANIVYGRIAADSPLMLVSHMSENGVIFSDGMESDFLKFNAGSQATITVAERQGRLVS